MQPQRREVGPGGAQPSHEPLPAQAQAEGEDHRQDRPRRDPGRVEVGLDGAQFLPVLCSRAKHNGRQQQDEADLQRQSQST